MALLRVQSWACYEFEWRNWRRALDWVVEEATREVAHVMGIHGGLLMVGDCAEQS